MACKALYGQQRSEIIRIKLESQQRENSGHQGESPQPEKQCRVCNKAKPLSSFSPDMSNKDGIKNSCKDCFNKAEAARYAARKERLGGQPPVGPPAEERICSACKETKPWLEFAKDARSVFGINNLCKKCDAKRGRDRYRRVQASSASASSTPVALRR